MQKLLRVSYLAEILGGELRLNSYYKGSGRHGLWPAGTGKEKGRMLFFLKWNAENPLALKQDFWILALRISEETVNGG